MLDQLEKPKKLEIRSKFPEEIQKGRNGTQWQSIPDQDPELYAYGFTYLIRPQVTHDHLCFLPRQLYYKKP